MEKIQMKHISICFFIVLISSPSISIAHDTTHIHPLITVEIAKLIELGDSVDKAYEDIYILDPEPISNIDPNIQRLYWGTDFDPVNFSATNLSPTDYYQNEDGISSYKNYTNVIDGVVQEDVPATKVTDHFYHAKNGKGLNGKFISEKNPSSIRAMAFLNELIERMSGYTEEAKQTSFFEFGQALHHVEDMSSPAHIHNDPHLTILQSEKDDYEGYFLPLQKRDTPDGIGATLSNYLATL